MKVKRTILVGLAAGYVAWTLPARAAHLGSVAGLVNLTNYQAALLVIADSPPDAAFTASTHKWVTTGQGFDDLNLKAGRLHIDIQQIDFTNSIVRVVENRASQFYVPQTTNIMDVAAGNYLRLENAGLDDVLDLYGALKGRTLLVHPDLSQPALTLSAVVTNKADAASLLERTLQQRGAVMLADGNNFEWIVPAGATNLISPAAIPARPAKASSSANAIDTLPPDSINFDNVDLQQVLGVYQALTAQKWVQDQPLPSGVAFTFHNQTPLAKAGILHAFDVLLAWHGLKVVDLDDKSFKLVPLAADK